jgi:hypothetical protein
VVGGTVDGGVVDDDGDCDDVELPAFDWLVLGPALRGRCPVHDAANRVIAAIARRKLVRVTPPR